MRLIDANAFLKDILTAGIGKTIIEYSESDIGYMIRKRPTVDAVTVVRCKDCKYAYEYQPKGSCRVPISCENENAPWYTTEHAIFVEENGYCSYGERKDGDK